jgi:hypothetical protein
MDDNKIRPGDMVVALATWPHKPEWWPNKPEKGGIYTVRGVTTGCGDNGETLEGLYLEELVNPVLETLGGCTEIAFYSAQFEKIKKPSIEALRQLVVNPPKELVQ